MNDKKPIVSTEKTSDLYPQSGLRELFARISAMMPMPGRMSTYTSGWARNQKGRDQKNKPDQPRRLPIENRKMSRAGVGNRGQRHVGSPAALGRAAGHEETYQHDNAPDKNGPVARHVYFREGHVRRADLERHDKIAKRGKRQWHDAEKDHDRAVHCA